MEYLDTPRGSFYGITDNILFLPARQIHPLLLGKFKQCIDLVANASRFLILLTLRKFFHFSFQGLQQLAVFSFQENCNIINYSTVFFFCYISYTWGRALF